MGLPEIYQILSLIHDTYEDGLDKKSIAKHIQKEFGAFIWEQVKLLSHSKGTDYLSYIEMLADKSQIALTIKLLDMYDNLKDSPSQKQKDKYETAVHLISKMGIKSSTIWKILRPIRKILGLK